MAFQKCPVCAGMGIDPVGTSGSSTPICTVCKGAKIIDEFTGKPPEQSAVGKADSSEFYSPYKYKCETCGASAEILYYTYPNGRGLVRECSNCFGKQD